MHTGPEIIIGHMPHTYIAVRPCASILGATSVRQVKRRIVMQIREGFDGPTCESGENGIRWR